MLLFVVDVQREHIAVSEANKLGIPVFGVVDTNSAPDGVDWVIPGNDDAIRAIRLYVTAVADAVAEGVTNAAGDVRPGEFVEVEADAPATNTAATPEAAAPEPDDQNDQGAAEPYPGYPPDSLRRRQSRPGFPQNHPFQPIIGLGFAPVPDLTLKSPVPAHGPQHQFHQ